jgi:hypothetical protein
VFLFKRSNFKMCFARSKYTFVATIGSICVTSILKQGVGSPPSQPTRDLWLNTSLLIAEMQCPLGQGGVRPPLCPSVPSNAHARGWYRGRTDRRFYVVDALAGILRSLKTNCNYHFSDRTGYIPHTFLLGSLTFIMATKIRVILNRFEIIFKLTQHFVNYVLPYTMSYDKCRMSSRMKAKTTLYILLLEAT